jgi:hypothetical protein
MNSHDGHPEESTHNNNFCYYSAPHSDTNTASQALIIIAKFNALNLNFENLKIPNDSHKFQVEQEAYLLPGAVLDLLRPPQI